MSTVTKLDLDAVMAKAAVLPALPQVVMHILDSLADEASGAEELAECIASDPAVVARLLAAANASAVGHSGRVTSVRQAIMLLGVSRIRTITMATAVIDRFTAVPPFDAHQLWLHSVGVAVCAEEIARHAGLGVEEAYTAGLLHDIGQLLMFGVDPFGYSETMRQKVDRDLDIITAERELLGIDHAQVGARLATLWKLPDPVAEAIAGHHGAEDMDSEMADAVHIAEVLAHALDLGGAASNRVPALSELSTARMGIEWAEFAENFPRIEARFDCARLMLGL